MNTKELKVEMIRYGDTIEALANFLGISKPSLHRKMNGVSNFKQSEMVKIKNRYNMDTARFVEVFYENEGVLV